MNRHFSDGHPRKGISPLPNRPQHDAHWPEQDFLRVDIQKKNTLDFFIAWTVFFLLVGMLLFVILGYFFTGALISEKSDSARIQARTIAQAVMAYQINHDQQFPPNLQALLEADPVTKKPYIEDADKLRDPWGQPYQFDPTGAEHLANGGAEGVPDVFTIDPTNGQKIGNWKQR